MRVQEFCEIMSHKLLQYTVRLTP